MTLYACQDLGHDIGMSLRHIESLFRVQVQIVERWWVVLGAFGICAIGPLRDEMSFPLAHAGSVERGTTVVIIFVANFSLRISFENRPEAGSVQRDAVRKATFGEVQHGGQQIHGACNRWAYASRCNRTRPPSNAGHPHAAFPCHALAAVQQSR